MLFKPEIAAEVDTRVYKISSPHRRIVDTIIIVLLKMKVLSTIDVLPILLLLSVGLSSLIAAERTCRRRAPPFTDCSSTTGECDFMFDSNDLPSALPFPPPK